MMTVAHSRSSSSFFFTVSLYSFVLSFVSALVTKHHDKTPVFNASELH